MSFTLSDLRVSLSNYATYKKRSTNKKADVIIRLEALVQRLGEGSGGGGGSAVEMAEPVASDDRDIAEQVLKAIYPVMLPNTFEARMKQFHQHFMSSADDPLNPVKRNSSANLALSSLHEEVKECLAATEAAKVPRRARGDRTRRSGRRTPLLAEQRRQGAPKGMQQDEDADLTPRDAAVLAGSACCIWCCASKEMKAQIATEAEAQAQKAVAAAKAKAATGGEVATMKAMLGVS